MDHGKGLYHHKVTKLCFDVSLASIYQGTENYRETFVTPTPYKEHHDKIENNQILYSSIEKLAGIPAQQNSWQQLESPKKLHHGLIDYYRNKKFWVVTDS